MDIEQAGIAFCPFTRHHCAGVGLIGALIPSETHIAMQSKKRSLAVAAQGDFLRCESGGERFDEVAERLFYLAFIGVAIGVVPFLILMERQRFEKGQGLGAKTSKRHSKAPRAQIKESP